MERKDSIHVSSPGTPVTERSRNVPAPTGFDSPSASRLELVLGANTEPKKLSRAPSNASATVSAHGGDIESLPWSSAALAGFRQRMQVREFALLEPTDDPQSARLDAVFSLPPELWPVLPPGALYCLESHDPRVGFTYLQHGDFPEPKVRVSTYSGKWCRDKVDFVVAWQPPRALMGSAWHEGCGPPPPQLPWEARQVLAHTTSGEYQYSRTRFRFRGSTSALTPDATPPEYCDAHGIDHLDTKAANEGAARNSDKDRDAHLLDPPKPNTWGEHARRPLIGRLRGGGGGAYAHHVMYDYSGIRTSCGRRVPAGYFFTLAPTAAPATAGAAGSGAPAAAYGPPRPASSATAAPARPASAPRARGSSPSPFASAAATSWLDGPIARAGGSPANGRALHHSISVGATSVTAKAVSPTPSALSRSPSAAGRSVAAPPAEPAVPLSPPHRWRTYGVPFGHPIHSARAGELAAWVAAGEGSRYKAFSDTAAVMKVAEMHLRLPRPFVPAPLVLASWADVPRMYAQHMAAARALMPVTDEDAANSTRLHMLLHHLQHAATLEYDRLDAKLALLPQMARLGRKSAEIDAWLQVIVAHAAYLYGKLQITNPQRWPQARLDLRRSARLLSLTGMGASSPQVAPLPDPLAPFSPAGGGGGGSPSQLLHPGTPSQAALQPRHSLLLSPGSLEAQPSILLPRQLGGGGGEEGGPGGPLPRPFVSLDEWAAVTRVMDTCRHAELYAQWVRLRPLMNGTAQPSAYSLDRSPSLSLPPEQSTASVVEAARCASAEPFGDGAINNDLLDYLTADMAAMSKPGYDPPPPPIADFPPPRGFRGVGPPPPPPERAVPAPVRTRGPEESPLPEEVARTDVWGERTRAGQASPSLAAEAERDPEGGRGDPGAVRVGQSAVRRLQAAKEFAQSRRADVRRALRTARGLPSPDYVWGPGDPPSAEPDGEAAGREEDDCDAASGASGATGLTSSSSRSGSTWGGAGPASPRGAQPRRDAAVSCCRPAPRAHAPGTGTQTVSRFFSPTEAELAAAAARARTAAEMDEMRRNILNGNSKSREQILDEALAAADAAIASLQPRPPAPDVAPPVAPRGTYAHYHSLTHGTEADPHVAYTFDAGHQGGGAAEVSDAVWKRLRYGWYGRDGTDPGVGGGAGGAAGGGAGAWEEHGEELEPGKPQEVQAPELQTVEVSKPKGLVEEYGLGSGVMSGFGVVDYETAMARRRAISAAVNAYEAGRDLSRGEVLDLFITFANLAQRQEMVAALQRALTGPLPLVPADPVAAAAAGAALGTPAASARGPTPRAAEAGEGEAVKQRVRVIAWLLGVTWRRISNETYASFICRVLGWPPELAAGLPRTRATNLIARALVRGHDVADVPLPPSRR